MTQFGGRALRLRCCHFLSFSVRWRFLRWKRYISPRHHETFFSYFCRRALLRLSAIESVCLKTEIFVKIHTYVTKKNLKKLERKERKIRKMNRHSSFLKIKGSQIKMQYFKVGFYFIVFWLLTKKSHCHLTSLLVFTNF